ncbi:MAG: hypothetical protein C4334_07190 [Pyrinomonas sp.]|uniref:hypothetical protein n=1 Tax=Pyrinomonas sp. TaxID=2080306 RepID=UPI0033349313
MTEQEFKGASFEGFAQVAESLAATSRKLEKAALLGQYLRGLEDRDLRCIPAGQQFALSDARTTSVGTALLREALSEATGVEIAALRPRYVRLGDAGEVAFKVINETCGKSGSLSLTLADVEDLIGALSASVTRRRKGHARGGFPPHRRV